MKRLRKPPPPPRRRKGRSGSAPSVAPRRNAAAAAKQTAAPPSGSKAAASGGTQLLSATMDIKAPPDVACAALLWRQGDNWRVTLVAKRCFAIADDGTLTPTNVAPPRPHEEMDRGQIVAQAELIPKLAKAEVYVVGYAFPLPGEPAHGEVRLVMKRAHTTLIERHLMVLGKRQEHGSPAPFGYVRLSYDNAFGGPGFEANPLGSGHGATANQPPPLLDAYAPEQAVACFAPIPSLFPTRHRRLGEVEPPQLDTTVALPEQFDWNYFQSAPQDQQLDQICSGDEVRVDGMRADGGVICFRVPQFAANAHVRGPGRRPTRELPLQLDQLHVDTQRRCATLVWRTSIAVESPVELTALSAHMEVTQLSRPSANVTVLTDTADTAIHVRPSCPSRPQETLTVEDMPVSVSRPAPFPIASGSQAPSSRQPALPGAPWAQNEQQQTERSRLERQQRAERQAQFAEEQQLAAAEKKKATVEKARREEERREAEQRRSDERHRFEDGQKRAREAEEKSAEQQAQQRKDRARSLRASLYDGFS